MSTELSQGSRTASWAMLAGLAWGPCDLTTALGTTTRIYVESRWRKYASTPAPPPTPLKVIMTFGPIQWVRDQFLDLPLVSENLEGRIVVVTGANTGVGFECAKHFLRMKPSKLILAVRSFEKGQAAALRMMDETKETRADIIEVWNLDMASFASVQAFAQRVETLPRLDIVVLNSGVHTTVWNTTGDGYEAS